MANSDQTSTGTDSTDWLLGSDGDDSIVGAGGRYDFIPADAGNDTIDGGTGDDCLVGGSGNDSLAGGRADYANQGSAGRRPLAEQTSMDRLMNGLVPERRALQVSTNAIRSRSTSEGTQVPAYARQRRHVHSVV